MMIHSSSLWCVGRELAFFFSSRFPMKKFTAYLIYLAHPSNIYFCRKFANDIFFFFQWWYTVPLSDVLEENWRSFFLHDFPWRSLLLTWFFFNFYSWIPNFFHWRSDLDDESEGVYLFQPFWLEQPNSYLKTTAKSPPWTDVLSKIFRPSRRSFEGGQ